jgi:hypothetical protein
MCSRRRGLFLGLVPVLAVLVERRSGTLLVDRVVDSQQTLLLDGVIIARSRERTLRLHLPAMSLHRLGLLIRASTQSLARIATFEKQRRWR